MRNSWSSIKTSHLYNQPQLQKRRDKEKFAAKLNREMTKAEWALWYYLRNHGFKAQVVLFGYIPDFVNKQRKLCIEVDGSIHDSSFQKNEDRKKDLALWRNGYSVIRFTNAQVLTDIKSVLARLGYKR